MPASSPAIIGALDASAIPRQSGRATKKTMILADKSDLKFILNFQFKFNNTDRIVEYRQRELFPKFNKYEQ